MDPRVLNDIPSAPPHMSLLEVDATDDIRMPNFVVNQCLCKGASTVRGVLYSM